MISNPVPFLVALAVLSGLWVCYAYVAHTLNPLKIIEGMDERLSSSKLQLWAWATVVLFSYIALYTARWIELGSAELPSIPPHLLIVVTLSVVTAAAAKQITVTYVEAGKIDKSDSRPGKGFFRPLVTDDGGSPDLFKWQMLVWTGVIALFYLRLVGLTIGSMHDRHEPGQLPDVDLTLVVIIGFSQAAYLGHKFLAIDAGPMMGPRPTQERPETSPKGETRIPASVVGEAIGRAIGAVNKNLKLTAVAAVGGIAAFVLSNYTANLNAEIERLTAANDAQKIQAQEQLRARDEIIHDLLPASLDAPVPVSPQNGSSLVGTSVVLRWQERNNQPNGDYLLEVVKPDTKGSDLLHPPTFIATNPKDRSTRYPFDLVETIKPGSYLWRVVPGDKGEHYTTLRGKWSEYYRFSVYGSQRERIKDTGELLVGTNYFQDSDFMRRDKDGNPSGFDYELAKLVAEGLGPELGLELGKPPKLNIVDYADVETLLTKGVLGGEVDLAIGSITRARYREDRGVRFTSGYFTSHLVLLGRKDGKWPLVHDDRVGVAKNTTSEVAAQYLQRSVPFAPIKMPSFQDLVNALDHRELDYIIIDEPLAVPLQAKGFRVITHLAYYLGGFLQKEIGYNREEYAIALRDSTSDSGWRGSIDRIMEEIKASGNLDKLKRDFPNLPHK
jgi:ABC-type amino acid transport substrate-binding protein